MIELKKLSPYKDITPAELNKVIERINILAKITSGKGIRAVVSQTGVHLSDRRRYAKTVTKDVRHNYSAKIQAGGVPSNATGPFTCKLLDQDGNEFGAAIDVYPRTHLGANDFDGDVWPDLAAADVCAVYKDLDGKWYFPFVFDDTTTC